MRFITEFEFVPSIMQGIKERECRGEYEIGEMIGRSFGWKVTGTLKSIPGELVLEKYQLEIEAFPMDKWIEFKDKFYQFYKKALHGDCYPMDSLFNIGNAIQELESFIGKNNNNEI